MGVSGFGPAPQINPGEFERRLREGVHRTGSNDAPSNLPRATESSSTLPHPALSQRAPNALERARTRKESTEPLEVRSSPQLHLPPGNETSIVDAEDPRTLDVDDFRRWWQQRLAGEAAQDRSRGRKLPRMAIALTGVALISSALVLKGGAPSLLKTPPVAPPANDIARAHNLSGQTADAPADISAMPRAGLSGTTPVAPVVDAQAVEGLASQASAQTADPEPARGVSVLPKGTQIAAQVSPAAERRSAVNAPKPPAKPALEPMNGTIGTTQPSIDLPAQRRGKVTARVVVGKTAAAIPSAAMDTPSPPLPMGTPVKPEKEESGAKALQPITEPVAAPATPAEAAKQSTNPLLRALSNLFGALALPARQSIDPAAVGSIGLAVQLGAPRPEAEAKRDLKRLNTKYGSALRGSTVGLRKVFVNGEAVYRLQVVGLSRDEAATLCSRVKGDGGSCSIVR
jgi:SPOR domain